MSSNPKQTPKPSSSTSSSTSSLAFTTHLASLISQENNQTRTQARPRPSKTSTSSSTTSILNKPNKGYQKRAAKDEADEGRMRQVHQRTEDIGSVDAATLHRSKRRMEEKARMYDDLKSGLYLAGGSDEEGEGEETGEGGRDRYLARLRRKEREGLVDFDRKWADEERAKEEKEDEDEDDKDEENEDDDDDDNASIISYEDELGRTRHGTRKQAAQYKQEQEQQHQTDANAQPHWKPARPDNLIYGPAIQTEAFQPSAQTAEQMSYLAARRDRSPTPPEDTHYDPDSEVRTRGTAFYAFSKDEETRRRQMEELMSVREETTREREGRERRRAERGRMKDERRKKVEELRVKRRAETFLANLGDVGGVQVDG